MQQLRPRKSRDRMLCANGTAMFCTQIVFILQSGVPLCEGISALGENMEEDGFRVVFHQMEETVRETGSLYQALKIAGIFPAYMVNNLEKWKRL